MPFGVAEDVGVGFVFQRGFFAAEFQFEGDVLTQVARFRPKGLVGMLYWYAVLPLHHIVFKGMLRGIAAEARAPYP